MSQHIHLQDGFFCIHGFHMELLGLHQLGSRNNFFLQNISCTERCKIPFEEYIGKKNAFPVKGWSLNSQLHSVPDCQSIIKKAAVKRLSRKYGVAWLEESGPTVQIQFSINKDIATIMLDTSGIALHKRGYRKVANLAPIRETLAAGILDIARIYPDTQLYDPFCGSGTFLIEAAYKAKNIAPGIYRRFAAEKWDSLPSKIWQTSREEAIEKIRKDIEFTAFGSDISQDSLEIAEANARRAGISGLIQLEKADVKNFTIPDRKSLVVTNPPYGERLMTGEDLTQLYQTMGNVFQQRKISSKALAEKQIKSVSSIMEC